MRVGTALLSTHLAVVDGSGHRAAAHWPPGPFPSTFVRRVPLTGPSGWTSLADGRLDPISAAPHEVLVGVGEPFHSRAVH